MNLNSSDIESVSAGESHLDYTKMAATIDLDEMEDRLDILEQVVEELRRPTLDRSELQILMTQYSHLEDVLLQAVMEFIAQQTGAEFKLRLPNLIARLSKSSADFQESWKEEQWEAYERAREGVTPKQSRDKPVHQTNEEIHRLQDLALTLSKLSRVEKQHTRRISLLVKPQTLAMVDQEARDYLQSKCQKPAPLPETQTRCHCLLM